MDVVTLEVSDRCSFYHSSQRGDHSILFDYFRTKTTRGLVYNDIIGYLPKQYTKPRLQNSLQGSEKHTLELKLAQYGYANKAWNSSLMYASELSSGKAAAGGIFQNSAGVSHTGFVVNLGC